MLDSTAAIRWGDALYEIGAQRGLPSLLGRKNGSTPRNIWFLPVSFIIYAAQCMLPAQFATVIPQFAQMRAAVCDLLVTVQSWDSIILS